MQHYDSTQSSSHYDTLTSPLYLTVAQQELSAVNTSLYSFCGPEATITAMLVAGCMLPPTSQVAAYIHVCPDLHNICREGI